MKLPQIAPFVGALILPGHLSAQDMPRPMVHLQPDPGPAIASYVVDPAADPAPSRDALIV